MAAAWRRPLRERVAMTGEITLRGTVLPVGGIKEKVLAARRANIREIYLPAHNRNDVEEIDAVLRESMVFHYVEHVDEVLRDVLESASVESKIGAREPRQTAAGAAKPASQTR